jgi:hypothetical protein
MRHVSALVVAGLLLAGVEPVAAQTADEVRALRESIESLRESQQRIERELQEIKTLLRPRAGVAGRPAEPEVPRDLTLSIDGDPSKGAAGARLVLVEFTDYQ